MPSNQPPVPPRVYSGYMWNPFTPSLQYIYDSTIGPSGAYRALTQGDVGGSTVNGTVQLTGTSLVGITGTAQTQFINSGIFASGIRMPATALSGNSGVSGTPSPFYTSAENGVLFVQQANLDKTQDFVTSYPPQFSAVTTGSESQQGVRTGIGTAIPAFSARKLAYVQNLGTGRLLIAMSGSASINNYSILLKKNSAEDEGDGGIWSTSEYLGAISITGSGNLRYLAWQA